ncbi:tetratricopeptide repeat protein [Nocardia nova]|uniref:tetratricopeptide repeat protein n=1 Tax=Nocardia nova TaxID=37330 RepID=UPI003403D269
MKAAWDVFLSYPRSDAEPAIALGHALEAAGLRVFWDDAGVAAFQSISDTIMTELGRSKVLLAYYSHDYATRRACQHELTTAFLAGQHEGNPRRRILVVNPEPTTQHIHPIELRDSRHAAVPIDAADRNALIQAIAAHADTVAGPISEVRIPPDGPWLAEPTLHKASSFVGRLPELWRLHSALHQHRAPLTSERGGGLAIVHGMRGIGKSRLTLEYAHRFRSAYPGGICWLTTDSDNPLPSLRAQRSRAMELIQARLPGGHVLLPVLWVLDNVSPGLSFAEITELLGPYPAAHTVITTTDRRHTRLGEAIGIDWLPLEDTVRLLRSAWPEAHPTVLDSIAENANGHPEALTIATRLANPSAALTDLARGPAPMAELAHRIFDDLDREPATSAQTYDVLRAIACLEPAPIGADHLSTVVAMLHHLNPPAARRVVGTAVDRLDNFGLLETSTDHTLAVSPLLGHMIRTFEPDPHRQAQIRTLTLTTLTASTARNRLHRNYSRSRLQQAAWALQVELDHLLSILNQPERGLRSTLSVLYRMVDFIRTLLTDGGPEPDLRPVQQICVTLLARYIRPTLTHWHPELLDHERRRQPATNPAVHERNWGHAETLSQALVSLRSPVTRTLHNLSSITGNSYGLPDANRPAH